MDRKDKFDWVYDEVMTAFADCHDREEFAASTRDLNFRASYSLNPRDTSRIMVEAIPDGYNDYNQEVLLQVLNIIGKNARYYIAREGSPCLYIKPGRNVWGSDFSKLERLADEVSIGNNGLRLWWD
jgi:hypothetical protein